MAEKRNKKVRIGRREWVSLPDLGIRRVLAKIDTGAWTTALHATDIESYNTRWGLFVRFTTVPLKKRSVVCRARVVELREIKSSNGGTEERFIIETDIVLGGRRSRIQVSLTDRDGMRYRMLLGRSAIKGTAVVDPNRTELHGLPGVITP